MQDTRRDILKKMIGTMVSSFAKPIVTLAQDERFSHNSYGLAGVSINIKRFTETAWKNIFSKLTSPEKAAALAQKAVKQPGRLKINDALAKVIVAYANGGGDAFADYMQEELLGMMPEDVVKRMESMYPGLDDFGDRQVRSSDDPDDSDDEWHRGAIDQFVQQPLEIAMNALKEPKYIPAGDIYYGDVNTRNPQSSKYKILYSAKDMADKGMYRGYTELLASIDRVIKDSIRVVKKELAQQKKANSQANLQAKNNIDYSPADYLGGAPEGGSEQHGYKLAVDHFIDADDKNLIALYECMQR
jgi:hypothetical protein